MSRDRGRPAARVDRDGTLREQEAVRLLLAQGLTARPWGNPAGDRYGWHRHGYRKLLYCVAGSITFHTDDGDLLLHAGDRLELPPGTRHAATVGPDGVRCVEGGGVAGRNPGSDVETGT